MDTKLMDQESVTIDWGREANTENSLSSPPDDFVKLINDYIENRHCLELLRFFGSHPRTRFNKLAILPIINGNGQRADVESALADLAEKGMVKACTKNNTTLYSLTENETMRRRVFKLIQLAWYHRQEGLLNYKAPLTKPGGWPQ